MRAASPVSFAVGPQKWTGCDTYRLLGKSNMDFGGFILFGIGLLGLAVGGIFVSVQFKKRSPSRRYNLGFWLVGVGLMALFGRFLYQVYGLDENLYIAADSGDTAQVKALLSAGASPNAKWESGTSALDAAKSGGHKDIVALLEKAGAEE